MYIQSITVKVYRSGLYTVNSRYMHGSKVMSVTGPTWLYKLNNSVKVHDIHIHLTKLR